ncbi:hypothetical protein JYT78_00950 [bacterium AH-315-I20]|nr:hypothetical protein [bacterium AH-315-I20]
MTEELNNSCLTPWMTNTDITMNQTLWLGIFPALDKPQLDFIAEKIEAFFCVNF